MAIIDRAREETPLLLLGGASEALPSSTEARPGNTRSYILPLFFIGITIYIFVVLPENAMIGRQTSKSIWRRSFLQQQRLAPSIIERTTIFDDSTLPLSIKALPDLKWLSNGGVGVAYTSHNGTVLTMEAGPNTARFNPPSPPTWTTGYDPAPALVFQAPLDQDWQLSAKITVPHFSHLFDSGCLFGYHTPKDWVNLCYEYSPEQVPEIVSVVTRGVSDDANGAVIATDDNSVYLRLSRFGGAERAVYASHWSLDGTVWIMNRHFVLSADAPFFVGFDAQAPTAKSNTAVFSEIVFSKTTLMNLRDGS